MNEDIHGGCLGNDLKQKKAECFVHPSRSWSNLQRWWWDHMEMEAGGWKNSKFTDRVRDLTTWIFLRENRDTFLEYSSMFISTGQVQYEYRVQEIENCKQRKSARTDRILSMKYLPLSLFLYFFIISYWLPKIKELELLYIFIYDICFTLKWDVYLPFSFFTLIMKYPISFLQVSVKTADY